jgi:uroporphyrinogen decarboxylase
MSEGARKLRAAYERVPGAPLYQKEFGYYSLERWKEEGMPEGVPFEQLFGYDPPGQYDLWGLGWCEAAFEPAFEEKVVEERGAYEVVQDVSGRRLLCFKERRSGFMPTYLEHPVKDWQTWEEDVKWRLDPATPVRSAKFEETMQEATAAAAAGMLITQRVVGGYMYLRSLIGPEHVLYAFYDKPDLIRDCMEAWLALADAVIARHQQFLTIEQFFIGEDICYKHGPLISPEMMREFIFPYYEQLIANIKRRQIDRSRHLYFHVDSDGWVVPVMPLYRELGMDVMSPFEVAAGCDVVEIGRQYPDLVILGGIDKRVLAKDRRDIDRYLERVVPPMRERGGYVPTCDHGVPAEVSFGNYLYYRKRMLELGR